MAVRPPLSRWPGASGLPESGLPESGPQGFAAPAAADSLGDSLVRRLRTKVARQLADTQRERERQGETRLAEVDEHALGSLSRSGATRRTNASSWASSSAASRSHARARRAVDRIAVTVANSSAPNS